MVREGGSNLWVAGLVDQRVVVCQAQGSATNLAQPSSEGSRAKVPSQASQALGLTPQPP